MTTPDQPDESIVGALLTELDYPVTRWRSEHQDLFDGFVAAADPLATLLTGVTRLEKRQHSFAVVQLLVRGLNDLITAFHLTSHAYLNQAYNSMRMAYEACDLVALVASDEAEARNWTESDRPWIDFAPANVRQRLGQPRADPFYSHLCGMSHPSFSASQLTGYMQTDEGGDPSASLMIGSSPLVDDQPHLAHAASLLGFVLGRLSAHAPHLVTVGCATHDDVVPTLIAMQKALADYTQLTLQLMAATGQPEAAEEMETFAGIFAAPLKAAGLE